MTTLSRKDRFFLALLILCWGVNWPIMKIGVQQFPPLSFRFLCMLGGLPTIWLTARLQAASLAIPRGQLRAVIRVTIPNMIVWHLLVIVGVKLLSSGRAAILGYTMPVWAVLFGLVLFGQRIAKIEWLGIACALGGALLLMSSEFTAMTGRPLGSVLVLLAAAGWGYGTVIMKRTRIDMPTISLTFWMLALATVVLGAAACWLESDAWRAPTTVEWLTIVYNALIVFGFAHVVWFQLARTLPPVASGLSIMLIPVVGVFSGATLLHETPHWQDYAAMALILAAMSTVLLKPNPRGLSQSAEALPIARETNDPI